MAIKISELQLVKSRKAEVITHIDDSILWFDEDDPEYEDEEETKPKGTTSEDWKQYLNTLDTKHLTFRDDSQPTLFLMDMDLSSKDMSKIKNHMMAQQESGSPGLNYGDLTAEAVRRSLRGIREPEGTKPEDSLNYMRDSDGFVHPKVMTLLHRLGIVDELFAQFSRLAMQGVKAQTKN